MSDEKSFENFQRSKLITKRLVGGLENSLASVLVKCFEDLDHLEEILAKLEVGTYEVLDIEI